MKIREIYKSPVTIKKFLIAIILAFLIGPIVMFPVVIIFGLISNGGTELLATVLASLTVNISSLAILITVMYFVSLKAYSDFKKHSTTEKVGNSKKKYFYRIVSIIAISIGIILFFIGPQANKTKSLQELTNEALVTGLPFGYYLINETGEVESTGVYVHTYKFNNNSRQFSESLPLYLLLFKFDSSEELENKKDMIINDFIKGFVESTTSTGIFTSNTTFSKIGVTDIDGKIVDEYNVFLSGTLLKMYTWKSKDGKLLFLAIGGIESGIDMAKEVVIKEKL